MTSTLISSVLPSIQNVLSFPFAIVRDGVRKAWRWLRRSHLEDELATARSVREPYYGFFQMVTVYWRFERSENRNVPYCPHCLPRGRQTPLSKSASWRKEMTLRCTDHIPAREWQLTPMEYEAARCLNVPAAQIVSVGGFAQVSGEPNWAYRLRRKPEAPRETAVPVARELGPRAG